MFWGAFSIQSDTRPCSYRNWGAYFIQRWLMCVYLLHVKSAKIGYSPLLRSRQYRRWDGRSWAATVASVRIMKEWKNRYRGFKKLRAPTDVLEVHDLGNFVKCTNQNKTEVKIMTKIKVFAKEHRTHKYKRQQR